MPRRGGLAMGAGVLGPAPAPPAPAPPLAPAVAVVVAAADAAAAAAAAAVGPRNTSLGRASRACTRESMMVMHRVLRRR